MKRLIILILTCLPIAAYAQTDHIAPLIEKYSTMKGCSTVILSKETLQSMGAESGIEYMQAIAVENPLLVEIFKMDIDKFIGGYTLKMAVNSDGKSVKVYGVTQFYTPPGSNKRESLDELLLVAIGENDGIVVRLTGHNIELNEATSLMGM